MKIRFSLRTLVLLCIASALPVYLGATWYMERVLQEEMRRRLKRIEVEIAAYKLKIRKSLSTPNGRGGYLESDSSSFNFSGPEWHLAVRYDRASDNVAIRKFAYVSVNIKCSHSRLHVDPIQIEYDDANENEGLVKAIQEFCEKNNWPCEARKVSKLENW